MRQALGADIARCHQIEQACFEVTEATDRLILAKDMQNTGMKPAATAPA